jgi:hypothetical protein
MNVILICQCRPQVFEFCHLFKRFISCPYILLPSSFPTKILYAFLISLMCATCPIHIILHDFITLIISSGGYKLMKIFVMLFCTFFCVWYLSTPLSTLVSNTFLESTQLLYFVWLSKNPKRNTIFRTYQGQFFHTARNNVSRHDSVIRTSL